MFVSASSGVATTALIAAAVAALGLLWALICRIRAVTRVITSGASYSDGKNDARGHYFIPSFSGSDNLNTAGLLCFFATALNCFLNAPSLGGLVVCAVGLAFRFLTARSIVDGAVRVVIRHHVVAVVWVALET